MSTWEYQHDIGADLYGAIVHPRFQTKDNTSPDWDGDMGVLVFVARIPRDGNEVERGMEQVNRLLHLLTLVAPDGEIPPMSQVLMEITSGVNFLLADPGEDGQS
jgi:hypothetical protein